MAMIDPSIFGKRPTPDRNRERREPILKQNQQQDLRNLDDINEDIQPEPSPIIQHLQWWPWKKNIPLEWMGQLYSTYKSPDTQWQRPWDVWKHATTAMKMSPFQADDVLVALGLLSPQDVATPRWARKEIEWLQGSGREAGPQEVWGKNWQNIMADYGKYLPKNVASKLGRQYSPEVINLWKEYYEKPEPVPPVPPVPPKPPKPPKKKGGSSESSGILPPGESYYGGYPPTNVPFPYPSELQTAGNVLSRFAYGLPTDTSRWWEAEQPVLERKISDLAKQQAEQFGLAGLRWSTPLQRNITDITGRETANLWADLAEKQLGLTEAAKNRGMQAAMALPGIAQQRFNMPMQWAQQLFGMGTGMQNIYQNALGRQYQDFLRMAPESNPWIRTAMSFLGLPSNMAPVQYSPSLMSQILGLGTMIPMIPGI